MRILVTLALLVGALARDAGAQPLDEVMAAIRNGGGWVTIPIVAGRGSASTLPLPTLGLKLAGCVTVWAGHSGQWEIHATETVADTSLTVRSLPGTGVRFEHSFGLRSQVDVDFVWSEPRDTTLFVWVGLDGDDGRDPCAPRG